MQVFVAPKSYDRHPVRCQARTVYVDRSSHGVTGRKLSRIGASRSRKTLHWSQRCENPAESQVEPHSPPDPTGRTSKSVITGPLVRKLAQG